MKKHKKSKISVLHVVLFISLVTGVALFGIYTSGILEGFISNQNIYKKKEDIEQEEQKVKYIIQYVNTSCGHNKVEAVNNLPEETFGENYFLEMGGGGIDHSLPEGWYVTYVEDITVLTLFNDLCEECRNKFYMGNHNGEIAVFQGVPPNGVFLKGLDIKVKDVYEEVLNEGVPYSSPEEMRNLLENFTS